MQYTQFGPSGVKVSRLSLGAMDFPLAMSGDDAQRVVDEAIDHGVNLIDTADSYGDSQKVLSKLLPAEKREKVFLATKVHKQRCRQRGAARCSRVNILDSIHRSLKELDTDYVDLFQLHHPDPDTPIDETLRTLDDLVKSGKTRYVGVSNHFAWHVALTLTEARRLGLARPISLQANYNLVNRQPELEVRSMLRQLGVGYMVYGPLARGLLAGKFHDEHGKLHDGIENPGAKLAIDTAGEADKVSTLVLEIRRIAEQQNLSPAQLSILWILSRPWVSTVLLGGSRPERFTHIYEVADRELPEDVVKQLDDLSDFRRPPKYFNQPFGPGPGLPVM